MESTGAPLVGSDDWSNIALNQLGGRRNVGGLYVVPGTTLLAVGPLSADVGKGDLGKGDLGKGDLGKGDLGKGDLGKGDLAKAISARVTSARVTSAKATWAAGLCLGDPNSPGGELDAETAAAWGIVPPNEFTACVIGCSCPESTPLHRVRLGWTAPTVGAVVLYSVYRVPGTELIPGQPWEAVGTVDPSTLPPGQTEFSLIESQITRQRGVVHLFFDRDVCRRDPEQSVQSAHRCWCRRSADRSPRQLLDRRGRTSSWSRLPAACSRTTPTTRARR